MASVYDESTRNIIRIRRVCELGSTIGFKRMLDWVAPQWNRSSNQPFTQHLQRNTQHSVTEFRSALKPSQKRVMRDDPQGDTWDVSLMYLLIQFGNELLADKDDPSWKAKKIFPRSLESLITEVKDTRNEVMHSYEPKCTKTFLRKLEHIRQLLEDMISLAGVMSNRQQSEIDQAVTDIHEIINKCRDESLEPKDYNAYKQQEYFQYQRKQVEKGKVELCACLLKYNSLSPVSLLLKVSLPISEVFTELLLVGVWGRNATITIENILEGDNQTVNDSVILVEGLAGIGKTSLVRKIISDWLKGKKEIKGLECFDMLFHVECRESVESVGELFRHSMSKTAQKFKENDMIYVVADFKTLFIIDGIDELNQKSTKLFKEILHLKERYENFTVLITTRPEAVYKYKQNVQGTTLETKHILINGIPPQKRNEFVIKYYTGIDQRHLCQQNIEGLLQYLKRTEMRLGYLWRSPYNLTLLVLLWTMKPQVVNTITTEPELHWQMLLLYLEKLEERLHNNVLTQHLPLSVLKNIIQQFLYCLYDEALKALVKDEMTLDPAAYKRLQRTCQDLGTPVEEMVGMFLKQTTTHSGKRYAFPHKGILDFMAARHILKKLKDKRSSRGTVTSSRPQTATSPRKSIIMEILQNAEKRGTLDISKYQNVLKHLLGFFYLERKSIPMDDKKEILSLLQQTGVRDRRQWLDVLQDVKCDKYAASFISKQPGILDKDTEIDDDTVIPYISLLQSLETPLRDAANISIVIEVERETLEIKDLLHEIVQKSLNVRTFKYEYAFRNPSSCSSASSQASTHHIKEIMNKCSLERYTGAFADGMSIPTSLRKQDFNSLSDILSFSVANIRDYESLCHELNKEKQQQMRCIMLCVSSEIAASDLKEPIPFEGEIWLFLPDASDIEETSKMAKALMPPTGEFRWLYFPRCGMKSSSGEMERLLQNLLHLKVKVGGAVVFPSPEKPEEGSAEGRKLENLARQLGASLGIKWLDEERMWSF